MGAGVYDILFRKAGPDEAGALDAEARGADNSVLVAGGSDPENMLKQMLHEYVSFALFSAGTALGSGKKPSSRARSAPILAKLRPQG